MNREMSSQRSLETLPGILGIHFLQCQRGKCRENSVSSKVKRIELNLSYHYPSETTVLVAQGAIVRYSPACNLQTVRLYIKSPMIHENQKKYMIFSSCKGPLFLHDMWNIFIFKQTGRVLLRN